MATPKNLWTRAQTLAALHLYLQIPFGQMHHRQPRLQELAGWIGRTPGAVAYKLGNLAGLDPAVLASGRTGMNHPSNEDRRIWAELLGDWDRVAMEAADEYERLASANGAPNEVDERDAHEDPAATPEGMTRPALVQVRVQQARFRRSVLTSYGSTCCVTGIQTESLLVASHIVPWSVDTKNRLNPRNGLCLSALHDRAYDQGLMTVLPDTLEVKISSALTNEAHPRLQDVLLRFDGQPIASPERFAPDPAFLAWHAEHFGFI